MLFVFVDDPATPEISTYVTRLPLPAAFPCCGCPSPPWGIAAGWRLGHARQRRLVLRRADTRHDITAHGADGEYRIEHDDSTTVVAGDRKSTRLNSSQ